MISYCVFGAVPGVKNLLENVFAIPCEQVVQAEKSAPSASTVEEASAACRNKVSMGRCGGLRRVAG